MSARYGIDLVARTGGRKPWQGADGLPLSFDSREGAEWRRRQCLEFECRRTRGANCRHEVVERREAAE